MRMCGAAKFPSNPFTPGAGHPPPHFGGRRSELGHLFALAGQLDGPAKPRGQVLVAPRGYGKTVMLRKFGGSIGSNHPKVRHIHTRASEVKTVPELIAVVAGATGTRMTVESFGVSNFGSGGEISTSRTVSAGVAVETALDKKPTILILDEAGELRNETAHVLLNSVESLMERRRPIMVVFAGTPKIYAAFDGAGTTFRERFDKKCLPLLGEEDSRAVIAEPMRANGMHIDAEALDHIVKDAMGYPHFLQTWGRQVYDAAVGRDTRVIDGPLVRQAHRLVRIEQEELYEERMNELRKDREVMAAAVRIARSFTGDGGDSRAYREIDDLVVGSLTSAGKPADRAVELIERLHEVGFIWRISTLDTADNWEAGIPSLMAYALGRIGERPA